jgi:hypothetical protein
MLHGEYHLKCNTQSELHLNTTTHGCLLQAAYSGLLAAGFATLSV